MSYDPDQAPEAWNNYGDPARYSEFTVGEPVSYENAGQLATGELLHLSDGEGGQLAIVENLTTGFPDVVPARELRGDG